MYSSIFGWRIQCNSLIRPHFPVHPRDVYKWNIDSCTPPGLHSVSLNMHCAVQEAHRNGANVYICACGVVEYCASENVTPQLKLLSVTNFELHWIRQNMATSLTKIYYKYLRCTGMRPGSVQRANVQDGDTDQDPLFHIVLVLFPVPVSVSFRVVWISPVPWRKHLYYLGIFLTPNTDSKLSKSEEYSFRLLKVVGRFWKKL